MTVERTDAKHARIIRALGRDGDILAVATDPSPMLEVALRDVVSALLLTLKFKKPGRPFSFDLMAFHAATERHWLADSMTKDDALLRAGAETNAPVGKATTRAARLKRLHKHFDEAERVILANALLEFQYAARTGKDEIAKLAKQNEYLKTRVTELEERVKKAERDARTAREAASVKRGQL